MPTKKPIVQTVLDECDYQKLKEIAEKEERTISKQTARIIKDWFKLSPEEQFIINHYRIAYQEDKKKIWNIAIEIDNKFNQEEQKNRFNEYMNNKIGNIGQNNGTINM